MDSRRICEQLWELEREHRLFEWNVQGVFVWKLVRTRIYQQILIEAGLHDQAHHTVESSIIGKVKSILIHLWNATWFGLHTKAERDCLILNHPRKVLVDGNYVDIYTESFIDHLHQQGLSTMTIDRPTNWHSHYVPRTRDRVYGDHYDIIPKSMIRFLRMFRYRPTSEEQHRIQVIQQALRQTFGTDGNLERNLLERLNIFKVECHTYRKWLRLINPKKIYVVIGRGYEALIHVANERGIEVYEIQHGIITKFNLDYSFPGIEHVPYFPNGLVLMGKYWASLSTIPLPSQKMTVFGSPYLHSRIAAYEGRERVNNQILFISQGTIGKKLMPYVLYLAKARPDLQLIVKLHPSEYHVWRHQYSELVIASQLENVEVVDSFERNLFELFATSKFQIGVYSTAIYEGIYMGCKTILIDLPGVEHLFDLVEGMFAQLVQSEEELGQALSRPFEYNSDTKSFFS